MRNQKNKVRGTQKSQHLPVEMRTGCREASMKEGGRQEGAVDRACGSQRKTGSSREEWSARSNDAGLQKHGGGGGVPCGFGNGQGFEGLCAASTEGRQPKTI